MALNGPCAYDLQCQTAPQRAFTMLPLSELSSFIYGSTSNSVGSITKHAIEGIELADHFFG
jgi:hypothetical protein